MSTNNTAYDFYRQQTLAKHGRGPHPILSQSLTGPTVTMKSKSIVKYAVFHFESCAFHVHTVDASTLYERWRKHQLRLVSQVLQLLVLYLATFPNPPATIFPKKR